MPVNQKSGALILGLFIFMGLSTLGYFIAASVVEFKQFERSVTVKGLSEREYPADIVIWPIQFASADNNLEQLYLRIDDHAARIQGFLEKNDISVDEISFSLPAITDKTAQQYGGGPAPQYRYSAIQTVTVYSENIDTVRNVMKKLSDLGKQGIVFTGGGYQYQTEYIFTRLNEVKPEMVEEATRKAREVAVKFAKDSQSTLGKIKKASQGQFSITARDKNNPHIKKSELFPLFNIICLIS